MKKITFISFLILLVSAFSACNREEGKGGTSIVQGYIYKVVHNDDSYLFDDNNNDTIPATGGNSGVVVKHIISGDTIPAAKTDVYIVYGNKHFYGDDVEAAPDGFYQFKYLTKGNYKIFAYSELAGGEKIVVEQTVKAGSGTTTTPDIYIHTGKAYGTSMIRGQLKVRYWFEGGFVDETNPVHAHLLPKILVETRVNIRRVGESSYIDEVRTDEDGFFTFQKLSPGKYVVTAYTADLKVLSNPKLGEKVKVPVKSPVIEITEYGKVYQLLQPLEIIDTL